MLTKRQYRATLYLLTCCLLALSLLSLFVGPSGLGLAHPAHNHAIFSYRLMRMLLALIAGSSLAASGASLQAIFQNTLADPHIFGISGGAAVGASLVIAFAPLSGAFLPSTGAILGGLLAFLLVFFYVGKKNPSLSDCLLLGILINALAAALITLLKIWLPAAKTQSLLYWLVGSIGPVDEAHFFLIVILWLSGMAILWKIRTELELLSFGIEESRLIGINTNAVLKLVMIANCLLIGNVVSFAGLIGFIGLVIPNMVRCYFFDLRQALPITIMLGALSLVFFDIGSRLSFILIQSEIPVGALSALCLSPLFFYLLLRTRHA